jgi:hypothetical protein
MQFRRARLLRLLKTLTMKNKVKVLKWIKMGMYPASICFSCGFSYDEIVIILKKKKAIGWATAISEDRYLINNGTAFALRRILENKKTGKSITYFYIILKDSFDFSDRSYCKLAHEVLHICQFFLPDVLDRNREFESEAYLHTFIMEECLLCLRG